MLNSFVWLSGRLAVGGFLVRCGSDELSCLCLPGGSAGRAWCCLVLSIVQEVRWNCVLMPGMLVVGGDEGLCAWGDGWSRRERVGC